MSTNDLNSPDEDLEMMEAIKAAFGDDAADLFDENAPDTEIASQVSLDDLVREIDSVTAGTEDVDSQQPVSTDEVIEKHLVVEVSGSVFGIPMGNVHEIQRVPNITFLPRVPEWVLGVTNLRGNVVSVVDFRQLLEMDETDTPTASRRLVMVHSLVDEVATGLVVDRVMGIRNLRKSKIAKTTGGTDQMSRFIRGMIDIEGRLAALLDIDKLLLSEDFRQFDAA